MAVRLAASPDRLVAYETQKTKRESLPSFGTYVILYALLIAAGGAMLGSSVGLALVYFVTSQMVGGYPTQAEFNLYVQYFSMAFFGLFFFAALLRQVRIYESLLRDIEIQEYAPRERVESVTRPMPTPQNQPTQSRPMDMRHAPTTRREATSLYTVLENNGWRFVRDVVALATVKNFRNIKRAGRWDEILKEWERVGYVENKELTDAGQEWLETELLTQ